jgi:hypothetical protein
VYFTRAGIRPQPQDVVGLVFRPSDQYDPIRLDALVLTMMQFALARARLIDKCTAQRQRAGSACLNSFPRTISGVLPGFSHCGVSRAGRDVGRA